MKVMNAIRGTVRPLVTVLLAIAFIWGFLHGLVAPDAFNTAVTMVLAFWFGSRTSNVD